MAYDLHIIRSTDFVRLDAHGKPNLDESRRVLTDIARACVNRGIDRALLDVRDAYANLSLADVYALARAFHEIGFRRTHRLGILHRFNSAERAEFFAMCANRQGFDVGAFDTFEEAIEWLNRPSVEVKIPVK